MFPELVPLARPAIRLHPRPGSPSVRDSSVGGPLLWPAGEPWPHCADAHLHVDNQAAALAGSNYPGQKPSQPTGVEVGSTDNMQIYVCPASPEHPHTDLIQ